MVTIYQDTPEHDHHWERTFHATVADSELIWHRDHHTRIITVVSGESWQLQMDNQLPQLLQEGHAYVIPAQVYHRVIKGLGDLVIQIRELTE